MTLRSAGAPAPPPCRGSRSKPDWQSYAGDARACLQTLDFPGFPKDRDRGLKKRALDLGRVIGHQHADVRFADFSRLADQRSFAAKITGARKYMWVSPFGAIVVTATLVVISSATYANPLTPFRYEFQAQRHCPLDTVVWLDFRKRVYYLKAQRQYARGFYGSFVCRDEARRSGFRRSLFGLR